MVTRNLGPTVLKLLRQVFDSSDLGRSTLCQIPADLVHLRVRRHARSSSDFGARDAFRFGPSRATIRSRFVMAAPPTVTLRVWHVGNDRSLSTTSRVKVDLERVQQIPELWLVAGWVNRTRSDAKDRDGTPNSPSFAVGEPYEFVLALP